MKTVPRRLNTSFLAVLLVLAASLVVPVRATTIFISEFMAENQTGLTDEDGSHSDWLELWNSGATSVSLNGWYLTDDSSNPDKWRFPITTPVVSLAAGARMVVFCSGKDRKVAVNRLHTNFKLNKAPSYLALVQPDGLTVEHSYAPYPQQVQDVPYGFAATTSSVTLVAPGAAGTAKVAISANDFTTNFAGWNNLTSFVDDAAHGWQQGATGFGFNTNGTYVTLLGPGGDVTALMHSPTSTHNTACCVRIKFNVSDPNGYSGLTLKMKYDDGFVAYLNGNLVAQSLASAVTWNASALANIGGSHTGSFESYPITNGQNYLVSGTNLLAIQMQNYRSNAADMSTDTISALCLPQLDGTFSVATTNVTYLTSATPGSANSTARAALGPAVTQTTNSVDPRPTGTANSAPIVVTAKVTTTLKPLAASTPVKLYYAVMFPAAETSVTMLDDGVAPDLVAGDKIYTAQIPTANVGAGQLIRWRVEAKDTANTAGDDPPYLNTTDNDKYYGTVTADGITTTQLSILHWFLSPSFVAPSYLPGTSGGCRCSFFYVERNADGTYQPGRFYDNVQVDLHGQSTAGFPTNKKSHDINFSQDNQFRWNSNERDVSAINLLTNYADKSKLRNNMAYEVWADSGHVASHFSIPVRVQQNGAFWAIYDLTENGNSDFLQRCHLDENGALYKIYDTLSDGGGSAEKKTGQPIADKSDLATMENSLNAATLANRRQYGFDNIDIPTLVNWLAVNDIIENNDQGHKNFYMYRDTFGTGEWSPLPWDQDLSFGHTWTGGQNYFDDDIDAQRPLQNGADNRLKELVWQSPELIQSYVRRLRTLADKYYISAATTSGPWEARMNQVLDQLDPPGLVNSSDSYLDMLKWGYWVDGNGNPTGIGTYNADHNMRAQAMRILSSNPKPPYPSSNPYAEYGYTSVPPFIPGRRAFFYTMNPKTSIGIANVGLPTAQPAVPTGLTFEKIEYNPGNQDQEYLIIKNTSGASIDVSGWKLKGAVTYTFRGGTVIPTFTSNSAITATGDVHQGRLHVARNPAGFRARAASPKGGEYRFVMGPYDGQLSARGETVNLVIPGATDAQDVVVATTTYSGAPTAAQNFLRVTELNYSPVGPTAAESAALPGVLANDFEFIELMNTGASALDLSGAQFDKGITFVFPAGFTLAGGARIVLVSNQAAFQLRYGNGVSIAGVYDGNFDNAGERVRLLDSVGEEVLDFTYDPAWYTPTDAGGYSLVTRVDATAWDQYDNPQSWAISGTTGGTPGASDNGDFAQTFEGWRHSFFTPGEELNPNIAGATGDPDGDLDSNFYEYAFGTNPKQSTGHQSPETLIVNDGGTNYPAVRFVRVRHPLDVVYTVEVNGNVANAGGWAAVDIPVGLPVELGNGLQRVTYRDSAAADSTPRFFRVKAVKQ